MSKHTPGPWEVQKLSHSRDSLWLQVGYNGRGPIARTASTVEPMPGAVAEIKYMVADEAEQWANARLIAAAPDLLDAAKLGAEALGWLRHQHPEVAGDHAALVAAIAKAEGS